MKLQLTLNGSQSEIDLLSPAPDARFRFDGEVERQAQVEIPQPGVYSILMDGRSYDARVEEQPGALVVVIDGYRFEIVARDPRRFSRSGAGRSGEGRQTVVAPMPGKIVRVLVAPGQEVVVNQGILVVEAMKMQNEMKAARAGKVVAISAREGSVVKAGEVLAVIE